MSKKLTRSPIFWTVCSYVIYLISVALTFYPDYSHVTSWPYVFGVVIACIAFYLCLKKLLDLVNRDGIAKYFATYLISLGLFLLIKYYFMQTSIFTLYSLVGLSAMYNYVKDSIKFMKIKVPDEPEQQQEEELEVEDNFDALSPAQKASLELAMKEQKKKEKSQDEKFPK